MTIIDRDALRRRDPRAVRELSEVARRVCRSTAHRYSSSAIADDIAQDATLAFLTANDTPREDEALLHVEGFLREAARRASLAHLRSHKKLVGVDSEEAFDAITAPSADLPSVAEVQARHRAVPTGALNGDGFEDEDDELGEGKTNGSKPAPRPRRRKHHYLPSAMTGRHIRFLRVTYGLTQLQMSVMLEVGLHSLRNYEYGTVKYLPVEVAERLEKVRDRIEAEGFERATHKSFLPVYNSWLRMAGLPRGDYAGLAKFLNIDRSTVWRWQNGECIPPRTRQEYITNGLKEIVAMRERRIAEAGGL
jgi:DNA-directed RNA polymerase specialized sigma24 family protein/DNA-binding transcriptional regulator YiaG